MDSNQRPANYESRKKPSDPVQRRAAKYKMSIDKSNKSALVRQDPSDWQSRLAVNFVYCGGRFGAVLRGAVTRRVTAKVNP